MSEHTHCVLLCDRNTGSSMLEGLLAGECGIASQFATTRLTFIGASRELAKTEQEFKEWDEDRKQQIKTKAAACR